MPSSGDIRQRGFSGYHAVKQVGGAGDTGRGVIGLCSPDGCQVIWDKPFDPARHNLTIAGWRSFTDTDTASFRLGQTISSSTLAIWASTPSGKKDEIKRWPHPHG
jgi:hypothetical protein